MKKHMNYVPAFIATLAVCMIAAHTAVAQSTDLRPTRTPRQGISSPATPTASPTPCVDTVLCVRGSHWSPIDCRCVPDTEGSPTPCVDTVLCIRGSHWSPTACRCVADSPGACASDSDCRLFSDTCTGCACRALSNDDPDPTCPDPGVPCDPDPCTAKTASCVNGQCTVLCVDTVLCIIGFHWSPEQCECVPDQARHPHQPHVPGGPHAVHGPHAPHSP